MLDLVATVTPKPQFIVASGDLTNAGDAESFRRLKSIMDARIDVPVIYALGNHDTRPGFMTSVGMENPSIVEEASAETKDFYVTRSAENADAFADVDVFVTYGDPDGEMVKTLQADPLLSKIPAIKRGSIAILEESTPLAASANPSPLSIGWGSDDYFDVLADAAKG